MKTAISVFRCFLFTRKCYQITIANVKRESIGWQMAAVVIANKHARILWAVLTQALCFDTEHVSVKPAACASAGARPAVPGSRHHANRIKLLSAPKTRVR